MGYKQLERSSSSGAVVAVILAVLLVGLLGIVAVGGVAFFWLGAARLERQEAVIAEKRAVAEAYRADAEAHRQRAEAMALPRPKPIEPGTMGSNPDLTVNVTENGNMSIDGERIELSDLRERLVQLKGESGKAVSVLLLVDANCLMRELTPVQHVCDEFGKATVRSVAMVDESESSAETEVPE
ncbi:MAG: hypothetical protein J5I93_00450 [Pirellulaceae bacterium]|nr:hypothetical protein [Pirellulaceae bacterium]